MNNLNDLEAADNKINELYSEIRELKQCRIPLLEQRFIERANKFLVDNCWVTLNDIQMLDDDSVYPWLSSIVECNGWLVDNLSAEWYCEDGMIYKSLYVMERIIDGDEYESTKVRYDDIKNILEDVH